MNKKVILASAIIFELVGSFVPTWLGDKDFFSLWSILTGLIGGIFGVWLGVVISKRFG